MSNFNDFSDTSNLLDARENICLDIVNAFSSRRKKPLVWQDSVLNAEFNNTAAPRFDLKLYLTYAKWIFASYLGQQSPQCSLSEAMAYCLAHATDFYKHDRNIYTFNTTGTISKFNIPNPPVGVLDITLNSTFKLANLNDKTEALQIDPLDKANTTSTESLGLKADLVEPEEAAVYIDKLNSLFIELIGQLNENKTQKDYDDDFWKAYKTINNNVVYLILLMFRRSVKSEQVLLAALLRKKTHENYTNLCVDSLGPTLPIISESLNKILPQILSTMRQGGQMIRLLILKAYYDFTTADVTGSLTEQGQEAMKSIWDATCMKHTKGVGLRLLTSFLQVADVYEIEPQHFLEYLGYDKTAESLKRIVQLTIEQGKGGNSTPPKTYKMFAWCRLFHQDFHSDLSHARNPVLCYALAVLIDKKQGLDKSNARNAEWTVNISLDHRELGHAIGSAVYDTLRVGVPIQRTEKAPSLTPYLKDL